jgi:hypothetical protein
MCSGWLTEVCIRLITYGGFVPGQPFRSLRPSLAAAGLLASGDLAPHIEGMTSTKNPKADAGDHRTAIARWDDEGGASRPAPRKNDAGAAKEHRRTGRNRTGINSGVELSKS